MVLGTSVYRRFQTSLLSGSTGKLTSCLPASTKNQTWPSCMGGICCNHLTMIVWEWTYSKGAIVYYQIWGGGVRDLMSGCSEKTSTLLKACAENLDTPSLTAKKPSINVWEPWNSIVFTNKLTCFRKFVNLKLQKKIKHPICQTEKTSTPLFQAKKTLNVGLHCLFNVRLYHRRTA